MSNRRVPLTDFPLNHDRFAKSIGGVTYFAADKSTVGIANMYGSEVHQIVQVTFHKGSIFVQFPYFGDAAGLIANATPVSSGGNESKLAMGEQGVVTPTLVKYSHPPDGNAHFSQDGKVYTKVRRRSFPLTQEGQVFELTVSYASQLARVTKNTAKKNRLYVPFVFSGGMPETAKVTGAWWSIDRLQQMADNANQSIGPLEHFEDFRRGSKFPAFLVGPTTPDPTHLLVISAGMAPTPSGTDGEPSLIFLGGWDSGVGEVVGPPTGLLACMYPITDPERWVERIGTVALPPNMRKSV